ncbi:MAG: hypothetical protein HY260_23575 [Chloroflexi bacterium]|nr:hypothetical protein [Chloroflexota bacterium]
MSDRDDLKGLWLHLICCGGPIAVFALIGLLPTLIAFVLTYKVLAAGVGLALAGALVWWGRVRRAARTEPVTHLTRTEPARLRPS